jgi:hypothetical protein
MDTPASETEKDLEKRVWETLIATEPLLLRDTIKELGENFQPFDRKTKYDLETPLTTFPFCIRSVTEEVTHSEQTKALVKLTDDLKELVVEYVKGLNLEGTCFLRVRVMREGINIISNLDGTTGFVSVKMFSLKSTSPRKPPLSSTNGHQITEYEP